MRPYYAPKLSRMSIRKYTPDRAAVGAAIVSRAYCTECYGVRARPLVGRLPGCLGLLFLLHVAGNGGRAPERLLSGREQALGHGHRVLLFDRRNRAAGD